jgi:glycogen(starch) synthase
MPTRPWIIRTERPLPGRPVESQWREPRGVGERAPSGALLLEVAWEVCNQWGGIYQVLRSKARRMVERWRNRYALVGPYVEARASLEMERRRPPPWLARVTESLAAAGVTAHHGRWLIPGRPRVILLEYRPGPERLAELKYLVWKDHGIETPGGVWLIDEVVAFAEAVRLLVRGVCGEWLGAGAGAAAGGGEGAPGGGGARGSRRVLAHFHEWLSGLAIPRLRREGVPAGMVFTTHATVLGRSIAWSDEWFYERLGTIDHAAEAARYNVGTQHAIERAAAHGADVFTTVSAITGEECAALLGRSPDLVLPNGINVQHYNVGHEFQTMHAQFKERINRFVMGHFFPSYSFDLDRTLYFFTSGRFEPRNKGFDLCLEAMARLNAELKAAGLGVTVVFFVITQRATRSIHPRVLEKRGILRELREVCERITADLGDQLFRRAAAGQRVRLDRMVDDYWRLRYRRTQAAMRTTELPPVVTHILEDEGGDAVLNQIRNLWITNRADDPVKVVYHPDFINPASPLWGLEYDQFVRGCHLGIFPSAYEPWGYTPLECVAMGVPSITSDLAGFGRYVEEGYPDHDAWGLRVLRRRGRTFHESAADLTQMLLSFCRLERRERIALRNLVEGHSWEFDWGRLGEAYDWAHDLAMARAGAGR